MLHTLLRFANLTARAMPSRVRFTLRLLTAFAVSAPLMPESAAAGPDRIFTVRGTIRAPYADGAISIQHEPIPGFMPAMTMPFYTELAEVRDLVPGDVVVFEFRVGERSRATKFRKVGRADSDTTATRKKNATPTVRRLREGDAVPAFTLLDQAGKTMTADDLRGRPTILTFIFTRCPVPEFCPLIGKKFQALQAQLARTNSEARLVSLTIDPEHDRPDVLRKYGESLGADFERWRFATGTPAQIEQLARLFAVRTERNGASLDHTLATALIGLDGKVIEIWRGNGWKPEEIVAKLNQR